MSKHATLFITAILLCLVLSDAARPNPEVTNSRHGGLEAEQSEMDRNCEGVKEDCLMKRALAAHLDYVYTQKETP